MTAHNPSPGNPIELLRVEKKGGQLGRAIAEEASFVVANAAGGATDGVCAQKVPLVRSFLPSSAVAFLTHIRKHKHKHTPCSTKQQRKKHGTKKHEKQRKKAPEEKKKEEKKRGAVKDKGETICRTGGLGDLPLS